MRYMQPLSSLVGVRRILPDGEPQKVAASVDGTVMAVMTVGREGRQIHVVTGLDLGTPQAWLLPHVPSSVDVVAVSDDGAQVAAATGRGEVRVWRIAPGRSRTEPLSWRWRATGAGTTRVLDFSNDGTWLLHGLDLADDSDDPDEFTLCEDSAVASSLRAVQVDARAMQGPGTALPDGLLEPDECIEDVSLSSARSDRLTMSVSRQVTDRDGGTTSVGSLRWAELTTRRAGQESGNLDAVVLGAGGRALATGRSDGKWRWQLPSLPGSKPVGSWSELYDTDVSGRYLALDSDDYEQSTPDHDALRLLVLDPLSGRRYSTAFPVGVSGGAQGMVVTSTVNGLLAHGLLGRDLLTFRLTSTSYPLGPGGRASVIDMDRVDGQETLVALTNHSREGAEVALEAYETVLHAGRLRHRTENVPTLDAGIVISQDSRSFVAWGSNDWDLRTVDGLNARNAKSSPPAEGTPDPESGSTISSVRRFGTGDFLILDGEGLARLEGATGRIRRLGGVQCGPELADDHACMTAVGRPGHPGQFLVLRADGAAECWELRPDGRLELVDEETLSPVPDDVGASRLAVFRPDGRAVALATREGVHVWRIGAGRPALVSDDSRMVHAYGDRGLLVVADADGGQELVRDYGDDDPVPLHASDVVTWVFDADVLHGETPWARPPMTSANSPLPTRAGRSRRWIRGCGGPCGETLDVSADLPCPDVGWTVRQGRW